MNYKFDFENRLLIGRRYLLYVATGILLFLFCGNVTAQVNVQAKYSGSNKSKINKTADLGQVTVTTWADGKKAAFSLSFDDGYMSQYTYAWPILKQFGFHGTFYLIGDAIADSVQIYKYGYWWQFRELAAEGNEIGDHTMTHPDLATLPVGDDTTPNTITYELVHSKQIIEDKMPGVKLLTMAYPLGSYNPDVISVASQYYEAARAVGGYVGSASPYGNDWYGLLAGNIVFDQTRSAADDQDKLNSYLNTIQNQTIPNGNWSIFLAHEVAPFADILSGKVTDYYPVSTEWLTSLCQWLKEKSDSNDLWVETVVNVMKYTKERENFSYTPISSSDTEIDFVPADNLDNSIYNYPLTVDIVVPSGWTEVSITQGNNTYTAQSYSSNGINYVRANIVPNEGTVTLTPNYVSVYVLSGTVNYNNSLNSPLPNVMLVLKSQTDSLTTVTDSSGNYSFSNLVPGNYTLSASKPDGWKGVNSTDALAAAKYFVGKETLDSLQINAADVNDDGKVNSTDALMIAQRYLHFISDFIKPDWVFDIPVSISIVNGNVIQNIKGMATGDINKSYSP